MIFYKYSRWLEIHQNYHIWKENMITPRIGKFFLKRPLLAVSNPGVQVRTWTNPGPDPGPGPILVRVQGLKKVAGPDLDRTVDSLNVLEKKNCVSSFCIS